MDNLTDYRIDFSILEITECAEVYGHSGADFGLDRVEQLFVLVWVFPCGIN